MSDGRRLYRSRDDRMIAGVCGGIARYLDLDATIVRLVAVALLIFGNAATLIAYIAMAVVVPEEPAGDLPYGGRPVPPPPPAPGKSAAAVAEAMGGASASVDPPEVPGASATPPVTEPPADTPAYGVVPERPWADGPAERHGGNGSYVLGMVLILGGALLLSARFVPGVALWALWPLIIVAAGLAQAFTPGRDGWGAERFFDGLTTVAIGGLLLGNTLGYLSWGVWWTVVLLWPVLLISAGFGILGRATGQRWLRVIGSVAVLAAIAYAGATAASHTTPFALWGRAGGEAFTHEADVRDVRTATLSLKGGVGDVRVTGGEKLVTANGRSPFGTPQFVVDRSGERASVLLSMGDGRGVTVWPGGEAAQMDVTLSRRVLWNATIDTGVSRFDADLSDVRVRDITLNAGVSECSVKLGRVPDGEKESVALVKAGVATVGIRVPKGVPVRVESDSGLTGIRVGGLAGKGGGLWESDGFARARDAGEGVWIIRIKSGVGTIDVDTY